MCVMCSCLWVNFMGDCCSGIDISLGCCNCWMCKPLGLLTLNPNCCEICSWTGIGYNCCCCGIIGCIREDLRQYGYGALHVNYEPRIQNKS